MRGFIEVHEDGGYGARHLVKVDTISNVFPLVDQNCTRICLTSGKSFETRETYDEIKELIIESMMDSDPKSI